MNINNIPQLSIKNNHLHMDGRDIVEIAGHYGTPLYIGSEQRIEDNDREVQQAFQKLFLVVTILEAFLNWGQTLWTILEKPSLV